MVPGRRKLLFCALAVLTLATAVPGTAATAQYQADGETEVTQTLVVDLQENGDARWTVHKTFDLSSANETEAFDTVAREFESGNGESLGLPSYLRAAQLASDSTGRDMAIVNVTRSTSRVGNATDGTGKLSISFTWTNFGRVAEDRFYIDDVFSTDPAWLTGLDADQRLVIRPPDGHQFFDASDAVTLRNGTIQLGENFDGAPFSATFERTGGTNPSTPTPTETPLSTGTGTPIDDDEGDSLLWAGLVTLGLGVVVVGYLLVREMDVLEESTDPEQSSSGGAVTDDTTGSEAGASAGAAAATGDDEETDSDSEGIDEELLSDEERVERLLERNGGRMKQATIVKETNWSNAKVSQLLSSMEDNGEISKLRIGRENLISFSDEDITDFEE